MTTDTDTIDTSFEVNLKINWEFLRQQKLWLLQHNTEEAIGLTNLIDYIQDTAVDIGAATEEQVFPNSGTEEE